MISIRLKHNHYNGARTETDHWLEARFNDDTGQYDLFRLKASWFHNKTTTKFGTQNRGQEDYELRTGLQRAEAYSLIGEFNYRVRTLERQNRGTVNRDGTKLYQTYYPFREIFKGYVKIPWFRKVDDSRVHITSQSERKVDRLRIELKP